MNKQKYISEYCTGCGLCESMKKAEMYEDEKGFPRVRRESISDVRELEKLCPVFYYRDTEDCDIWGNVDAAYVGWAKDEKIRFRAASGGALTEICSYLLESNSVGGIIQTTFRDNDPTKTKTVVSYTAEEVRSRCGSRYSISSPLKEILSIVEEGKRYAFVGKPCDVMTLRLYMNIHPELKNSIRLLLSFFCAGEPSAAAQDRLLEKLKVSKKNLKGLTYRGNGWPGYTTAETSDGRESKLEYKVAWGQYLGRDIRKICRFCLDGTGELADIVCADFWQLDSEGKPDFSEHEGRNIIISRSKDATEVVEQAIKQGYLTTECTFTDKMDSFRKYQPAQFTRKTMMKTVISAMRLCLKPAPDYNRKLLDKHAGKTDSRKRKDYFIGTLKRIIKGRI